ncbi:hypothetical protein DPMN_062165, partial [Dreissena polymorpha]
MVSSVPLNYPHPELWPYHVVCDVILASTLSRNLSTLASLRNFKSTHFFYTTSKKNVYKLVGQYNVDGKGEDEPNINSSSDIRYIDHDSQMTPIDFEVTMSKVT